MAAPKKAPAAPAKKTPTAKAPAAPAKKTAAAPAAPKEPKAPKAPKAPAVQREQANGVTRPKAGSKTGRVWEIADSLSAKNAPATRAAVMEAAIKEDINEATVATQYQRWRTFFGVQPQRATKAAE